MFDFEETQGTFLQSAISARPKARTNTSHPIHEIKTNGINGKAKTTFAVLVLSLKSQNHKSTSSYELVSCPLIFLLAFVVSCHVQLPCVVLSCVVLVPYSVSVGFK